ncbi:UNVERIFIED_CONTAM: hypothetical protein K2H54_029484 [Gekko kuhli]
MQREKHPLRKEPGVVSVYAETGQLTELTAPEHTHTPNAPCCQGRNNGTSSRYGWWCSICTIGESPSTCMRRSLIGRKGLEDANDLPRSPTSLVSLLPVEERPGSATFSSSEALFLLAVAAEGPHRPPCHRATMLHPRPTAAFSRLQQPRDWVVLPPPAHQPYSPSYGSGCAAKGSILLLKIRDI